jgi:hypothetical protein
LASAECFIKRSAHLIDGWLANRFIQKDCFNINCEAGRIWLR